MLHSTHNTLFQQKEEIKILLSGPIVQREKYAYAEKYLESDLIKIITGPRRAGKSFFALLLLRHENFAYVNFDDENLVGINTDDLLKSIFEVYPNPKFFLFDEIQNLDGWELFVNKLHRRKYNLILTGSNSKMLSKELATALTGRHIQLEIFPFSWNEFLEAKKNHINAETKLPETRGKLLNTMNEFLLTGGYPEIVVKKYDVKTYLPSLFDAILLKDIVRRYNVRYSNQIYNLSQYLLNIFSSEFSFNKIKNTLQFNSVHTVQKYLSYLEEPYLFFYLNRFSFKVKEILKSPRKIYVNDNGFISAKATQLSMNYGRMFENMVVCEMIKSGLRINIDLFSYKTHNQKEIDVLIKEGIAVTFLIQIAYHIIDEKTEQREIKALCEASNELKCNNLFVITWDNEKTIKIKGKKIQYVPFWKWAMKNETLMKS